MAKAMVPKKTDKIKPIKIELTNMENINPIYSNFAQIAHTPHEFTINFCYLDQAKITKGESPKAFAECISRIVVSPSFLPIFINALKVNQQSFNESIKKEMEFIKKEKEKKK